MAKKVANDRENKQKIVMAGRPKGVPNRLTAENKQILAGIFDKTASIIMERYLNNPQSLEELPAKDLFDFFTKMLPFVVPRVDVENANGNSVIAERIREITRMVIK